MEKIATQVTISLGGANITLPAELTFDFSLLSKQAHATAAPIAGVPRIGTVWDGQGGIYAGVVRGDDGKPDYHLIVHEEDTSLNWKDAVAWAKGRKNGAHADYSLPKRKEQAVMFGNVKELFQEAYYWSGTQSASASDYAWYQNFSNGDQTSNLKHDELRARAVRRLPIE